MLEQDKQLQLVNKKWRKERIIEEKEKALEIAKQEKALRVNQEREARQQAQRNTTEANRLDGLARPYTNSATSTRGERGGLTNSGSSSSSALAAPAAVGPKKQIKRCFVCYTPLENPVKCGAKSCRVVACDKEACQTAFEQHRENAHTT